ncbi:hypothetical protein FH5_03675 [Priestia endophytica]|jgi:hypothetical protein|nr:hypothetical protein FH5_03675 [Priestia endophytica]
MLYKILIFSSHNIDEGKQKKSPTPIGAGDLCSATYWKKGGYLLILNSKMILTTFKV